MTHEHGGNIHGRDITLDFSASLNPLGMPESVRKAASAALYSCNVYPDPCCRELVQALSRHEGINESNIVCGNGADDLIYRIMHALKPKKALIAVPAFSEYRKAVEEAGCEITEYLLDESGDFEPDDGILRSLDSGADMLIMCSPDNPTGRIISPGLLEAICRKCLEKNIVFVCDECFTELSGREKTHSAKSFINDKVIILKAFTKTYAMPGLRLGYALFGSKEYARLTRGSGQFWSVSSPAQAAGLAALGEGEYVKRAVDLIGREREYLSGVLKGFGFKVYHSEANFILFRCDMPLYDMLLEEKIMIRDCGNFRGLGEGYFRTAVRTHEENTALAAATERALEQVIKWQRQ